MNRCAGRFMDEISELLMAAMNYIYDHYTPAADDLIRRYEEVVHKNDEEGDEPS